MFRIRIRYADFGVVMASRVWRGRRALGLSVRVARLARRSTFLLFEWRFRMPETARTTHRQWRQEHCANPGTRARRHAPTRPPPRSRRGEEAACPRTDRRHRDADPSGCDVTLPISYSHFMQPLRGSPPVRASLQAYPSPVASRQASSQQGPSARPSAAARRTAGMSRTK